MSSVHCEKRTHVRARVVKAGTYGTAGRWLCHPTNGDPSQRFVELLLRLYETTSAPT
jgi:hypothetical protein